MSDRDRSRYGKEFDFSPMPGEETEAFLERTGLSRAEAMRLMHPETPQDLERHNKKSMSGKPLQIEDVDDRLLATSPEGLPFDYDDGKAIMVLDIPLGEDIDWFDIPESVRKQPEYWGVMQGNFSVGKGGIPVLDLQHLSSPTLLSHRGSGVLFHEGSHFKTRKEAEEFAQKMIDQSPLTMQKLQDMGWTTGQEGFHNEMLWGKDTKWKDVAESDELELDAYEQETRRLSVDE
jgi:hypothetical protein